MPIIDRHLSPKSGEFRRAHAIVIGVVVFASLAAAPFAATPARTPSDLHDLTAPLPAADAEQSPVVARSLGYVEFDWSDGDMPGFEPLLTTGDSSAGR